MSRHLVPGAGIFGWQWYLALFSSLQMAHGTAGAGLLQDVAVKASKLSQAEQPLGHESFPVYRVSGL